MMASSISANQGISKQISEKIPFAGTWFYPISGVEQIIFPDFQLEGASIQNEIYWPSAQLANLYTAWSPQQVSGAPYTATITPENGIKERFDAIQDGGSGGINYINAYGQKDGFTDILQQIYSSISYAADAKTQALISNGQKLSYSLNEPLASALIESYSYQADFKPFVESIFGTQDKSMSPADGTYISPAHGINNSLAQMVSIIRQYPEIIKEGTRVRSQYETAKLDGETALYDFGNQLLASLASGAINWGETFNQGFGTLGFAGYQYNLPWNDALYEQYKTTIDDPRIVAYQEAVETIQGKNKRVNNSLAYLYDLKIKNETITSDNPEGNWTNTPVSLFDKVKDGPDGAPVYAARWSTSPIVSDGGNSIEFDIQTDSFDSQTTNFYSESQWVAEADDSVNGWFFSAGKPLSDGSTTKNSLFQLDNTASNISGSFQWSDLQSKNVTPSSDWWFPDAVSQAWSQTHTINDPHYSGGYGFLNPNIANKFIASEIYRLSSITYGTPSAVVSGRTSSPESYTPTNLENIDPNASSFGGIGWGPFSFGNSSSFSSSDQKSSNALEFRSSSSSFTLSNNPLDGFSSQPGVGSASSLVGVTVTPIGNNQAQPISSEASSSRKIDKVGESLFTFTAATHANKRHYHDLGGGHDTHYGGPGKSIIDGGKGQDTLAGLNGSDILRGQKGNDVIYPGKGKKNIVHTGKGNDFIVFEEDDLGFTVVKDFSQDDRLSFSGFESSSLRFEGKILLADDIEIAKFKGKDVIGLLEAAIEDAHFSLPMHLTPIEHIS